jgi:naphthalene 1,2-dioxygenase ferredoxin reductase component
MPNITIANVSTTFPGSTDTILDAALEAGLPFPHGCRAGNCGACKTRLVQGKVYETNCDSGALDEAARAEGLILACQSKPQTDVTVEWLGEVDNVVYPVRKHTAVVSDLARVTHDITRVRFELTNMPMAFAAGQYAELSFGRMPVRPYSMANRPDQTLLEFHVRRMPNGLTSGYVAERLQVGESVRLKGPYGSAYLRDDHNGPIVAIAGGCGLAPIKSIVETALARGINQDIHLYFGVQDERDVYDEAVFLGLADKHANFHFVPVLSAAGEPTERRTGWVHDAVAADLGSLTGCKVYMAGPPPMVDAVTAMAVSHGARPADIHADPFFPAAERQASSQGLFGGVRRLFGLGCR